MSNNEQIFDLLNDTLQAYHPFYREDFLRWQRENEIPQNWFAMNAIRAREPETFSIEDAKRVNPYAAKDRQQEILDDLAQKGYLSSSQPGCYDLTENGRAVIEGFFKVVQAKMSSIEPIPGEELHELRSLLERLVKATLEATEPSDKLFLQASRWTDPGPESTNSVAIDQAVTDLLQFRDDAHMAAWQSLGVSGRTWETLTLIWREEADSPGAIAERQSFRGYSEKDYQESVSELLNLGWVQDESGKLKVTAKGRRIREDAELKTDHLFYEPWSTLEKTELDQLEKLLKRVINELDKEATTQFWSLATEVSRAISPVTRDVVQQAFQENFDDNTIFFPTLLALGTEPEPFSANLYQRQFPFSNAELVEKTFESAVAEDKMVRVGDGGYLLTDRGKDALFTVNDVFYRKLGEIDPLEEEQSTELLGYLTQLVDASLNAEKPSDKWGIENMQKCHPKREYQPLAKIDQRLDDLSAFRDDSHNSAWKIHDISPRAWEAFTLIWRGEASSSAGLVEKLSFRGYSAADYDLSLNELENCGWLQSNEDGYTVTVEGNRIRQEAEDTTNALFYEPWETLTSNEKFRLRDLFLRMKLGLEALHPKDES